MLLPPAAPWFGADRKPPQSYRGLRIKTDTHLHEQLEAWIARLVPLHAGGRKPRVLDLGCGEGAMAQRLHDLGYEVVAVDRAADDFKAHGPRLIPLDLDDPASFDRLLERFPEGFDLVLALEVIEHLRSPWQFLAACRRLCPAPTHLLVSTPNVASWWGRIWFFLTGDLWGFCPESWRDPGHISPLTLTTVRALLAENGLECLAVEAAGSLPVIWGYNWKRLLLSLAVLPLRPLMRGPRDGWVLVFHAQAATAHDEAPTP